MGFSIPCAILVQTVLPDTDKLKLKLWGFHTLALTYFKRSALCSSIRNLRKSLRSENFAKLLTVAHQWVNF